MRAVVLSGFDHPVTLRDIPVPEVPPGHVRVRMIAAGLNRIDVNIAIGAMKGMVDYDFPVVLGRAGAGVVDALGDGVTTLAVGDEVVGHVLLSGVPLRDGTLGEYAILPIDGVAPKPSDLDFVDAAALPLAGSAALAIMDAIEPLPDDVVLVVGASGGVGSYVVQLVAARGATAIATGLPEDADRLRELGAARVVDYRQPLHRQVTERVDTLVDLVNYAPDGLAANATLVRDGGMITSSLGAADDDTLSARDIKGVNVMAAPQTYTLTRLVEEV
ncbi:MAG TPA: NADP-dependent oxidoreductase, partial [Euzebyales bacterium]|nr:NADP-dependent oxidoreductase [Euzebyales bacterium]